MSIDGGIGNQRERGLWRRLQVSWQPPATTSDHRQCQRTLDCEKLKESKSHYKPGMNSKQTHGGRQGLFGFDLQHLLVDIPAI